MTTMIDAHLSPHLTLGRDLLQQRCWPSLSLLQQSSDFSTMTSETQKKAGVTPPPPLSSSPSSSSYLRFIVCTLGICFSYWFYGFLQEKLITKSRLGATFMLVIQTITNIAVALIWQQIETPPDSTRSLNHHLMAVTSTCYVLAMAASNESLRYVSYPVAVLGKSCKMIPTMAMGVCIERRRYSAKQWCAALCISVGIAVFHVSRKHEGSATTTTTLPSDTRYWTGMLLLCISLCMDGFLGACQGILKRPDRHDRQRPPTAVETMLYINVYALVLLIPMAVMSGQWEEGISLLLRNEQLQFNVLILNLVVGMGQVFIFLTITWYSSLVTTTITTTRKFFTILFSVLHFKHSFSLGQWISVIMVFSGLYLSIAGAGRSSSAKSQQESTTASIDDSKKQK
jgi:UDP-galactose transporter B1